MFSALPVFRFTFVFIFYIAAAGVLIQLFRYYQLNYLYLFELDPRHKVTHIQIYKVALALLAFWQLCFLGHVFLIKMTYIYPHKYAIFPLVCLSVFLVMFFLPCHIFYRKMRWEFLKCFLQTVISPFSPVRFKQYFLADILTSMNKPF